MKLRHYIFCSARFEEYFWFRIFGLGATFTYVRGKPIQDFMLFSDRMGYRNYLVLMGWKITLIGWRRSA